MLLLSCRDLNQLQSAPKTQAGGGIAANPDRQQTEGADVVRKARRGQAAP